ncbi:hypothetical protein LguiB_027403 [Lonicera macranthoides]
MSLSALPFTNASATTSMPAYLHVNEDHIKDIIVLWRSYREFNQKTLDKKAVKLIRCKENERQAVLNFRKEIVDYSGLPLFSWGSQEEDCCKWRGIRCSNTTGHVILLDLHGRYDYANPRIHWVYLNGKVSPSLLELNQLKYLDLSYNSFYPSPIPKFTGSLSKLQHLNLSNNNFVEWLSDLRLLWHLDLSQIDLEKVDLLQSISRLSFLSSLHLVHCNLPGIISPSLHLINFYYIPLSLIDLSENSFTNSSSYNWLFIFSSSLVDVDMFVNPLRGSIPDAFGNMMSLETHCLSYCGLEDLGSLNFLSVLDLSSNNFSGKIPLTTKLQTFNAFVYAGNDKLCGLLLPLCPEDESTSFSLPNDHRKAKDTFVTTGFYVSVVPGFAIGFWGFIGPLMFRSTWRYAYFKLLDKIQDPIYVTISVNMARYVTVEWTVFVMFWILYNVLCLILDSHVSLFGIGGAGDDKVKLIKCRDNERQALLDFKKEIVDDFGFLSSWGSQEEDCCKWRGIECSNRTGHVILLNLHGWYDFATYKWVHLNGKVSPSLLELNHLKYLDLSQNHFKLCPIPEFIGSLSKLQHLNMSYSYFVSRVPHQLGNLTNLRSLDLGFNYNLTVENLVLEYIDMHLDLSSIDLQKVDLLQSIDRLSFLSSLHLHSCKLPGIISPSLHITNFSSIPLSMIDLSSNRFTNSSSYNWLFNFSSSLLNVDMSFNPLGGYIPDAFGNMMFLKSLRLRHCALEGELPKTFMNISHLRSLDLSSNNLIGHFPELFQTLFASKNSLEFLALTGNKISGSIPDFTSFSSLRQLGLRCNKLNGSFPKRFGQSSLFEYLDLSENELNGSLPDLTSFPLLKYLYLCNNTLKVRSESIRKLSKLKELDLSFNLLTLEFSSDWTPYF